MKRPGTSFLISGSENAPTALLLAHGAGAPMTSLFLEELSQLIATAGVRVARFEFGYMAQRRQGQSSRPPPKAELLMGEYDSAIERTAATMPAGQRLIIAGKSMGGRVASMVADRHFAAGRIGGLVCFGYPFHPPRKPESTRTSHLVHLACPTLIVQGERDPFGSRKEVAGYQLSTSIRLHWIENADHDLAAPRRKSSGKGNGIAAAADAVAAFIGLL